MKKRISKSIAVKQLWQVLFAPTLGLFIFGELVCAQPTTRSPAVAPVSLTVTVTNDRKEVVSGLPRKSFTISDDTGVREIVTFNGDDEPVSVLMLIDLSGSLGSTTRAQTKVKYIWDALSQFVLKSNNSNEYFIVGFNATPYLWLDGTRDTNAVLTTLQKLATERFEGNTALYDACLAGIDKVARGRFPKKVILLVSDGLDTASRYDLNEVRRRLNEMNVLLYAVNIKPGWSGRINEFNTEGPQVLEALATLTGGTIHGPDSATKMKADLERIALELRKQYSLSFIPPNDVSNGKWHPVKIKVSVPGGDSDDVRKLQWRSRKGYYSVTGP